MGVGEISITKKVALHSLCSLSLVTTYSIASRVYSWNLITHTFKTLGLLLVKENFASARQNPLLGDLVVAFGAIVLGAPVGTRYFACTITWSLLMSLFTFVPSACIFGSSRKDWLRILSHFKPEESLDALVSLPAYGSVVGAWIGAWPMPLDWERPWQEYFVLLSCRPTLLQELKGHICYCFESQNSFFPINMFFLTVLELTFPCSMDYDDEQGLFLHSRELRVSSGEV